MKWRKGPRPWPIHLFALIFLAIAVVDLIRGLSMIDQFNAYAPENPFTGERLGRDGLIVLHSAMFTIFCIPVVLIWVFGSKVARWIVTAFVLWSVASLAMYWGERQIALLLEGQVIAVRTLILRVAALLGVCLLFHPASSRWLQKKREIDPETFA